MCGEGYNTHQSNSLCGHLFSKRYVANTFCVFLCNFISVTSSSVLMTSSMVAEDSVTLTSSIFMTSEVDVTISTSTKLAVKQSIYLPEPTMSILPPVTQLKHKLLPVKELQLQPQLLFMAPVEKLKLQTYF